MNYQAKTKGQLIKELEKGQFEYDSLKASFEKDLTDSKLAEEALLINQAKYQAIFESTGTATLIVEEDTTISMANQECFSLTGYSQAELIGQKWTNYVETESLQNMIRNHNLRRESPSLAPKKYEVKLINKKGEVRYAILDIGLVRGTGQSIVSILDITNRIMAEQALEERTKDLQKELEERKIAEKKLKESHKQLECSKLATINLLEDIKLEMDQRKKVEEEVKKLNSELEKRVIERTSQLEEANKELQAFAYSVSHDLRAPLRAIDGFSKFVLEDHSTKLNSEGKRLVSLIRINTQKMDKLITDILALSRVTRSEHKKSKVDMTKMAMSMFNEVASPEIKSRLNLIIDTLPVIFADPTYIKQVWINLISNAIKFSSLSKHPEIRIGGYIEKETHVYYVKDNGVGFNPEYGHKLFGVFQRLHKDDEFEGTGVGLAIVQRIVHRHGGKVWAEGKEGKGATFYFSLPAKKNS
jgi:PAS domain S-box-containing protein